MGYMIFRQIQLCNLSARSSHAGDLHHKSNAFFKSAPRSRHMSTWSDGTVEHVMTRGIVKIGVLFLVCRQSFGTPSWPPKRKTAGICKNVQQSAFRHRSAKPCFLLTHAPKFACASSRRARRALKKFRLGLALMWLSNARFCSPFKSRPGQLFH